MGGGFLQKREYAVGRREGKRDDGGMVVAHKALKKLYWFRNRGGCDLRPDGRYWGKRGARGKKDSTSRQVNLLEMEGV